jgi:hypothetical protein
MSTPQLGDKLTLAPPTMEGDIMDLDDECDGSIRVRFADTGHDYSFSTSDELAQWVERAEFLHDRSDNVSDDERNSQIHTALRAAVTGSATTGCVNLISLQLRVITSEPPPGSFVDRHGYEWKRLDYTPLTSTWVCVYERILQGDP